MKIVTKKSLAVVCASVLSSSVAFSETLVEGRITDSDNKVYFEGALIELVETKQNQVSERDGSFRFNRIADGSYTLRITYLGANPVEYPIEVKDGQPVSQNFVIGADIQAIENVIVVGQQAGQAIALNKQKNANRLVSISTADAIGQFPDQNAAEALQRLPGIAIQRDQGEGRFVGIRGIDPSLNNVTINGVNVPSPEAGVRSVAMDVLPAELIASLEVSKSVTPDMDADAIGGSIEVKSLSAFDREGQSFSLNGQTSYNDQVEEYSPKLSGSYTNIFEFEGERKFGVAAALSWYERKFGSHNKETDGGWGDIEVESLTTEEDVEFFGAEEIEQRHYLITRERLGAAVNFDYQTSSEHKYYLRTLYSEFSDDEYRLRNEYKFADGKVLDGYTDTAASFVDAEMDRDSKDRFEEQEIISLVAGGENHHGDWTYEYNLGYSKSSETEPDRLDIDFKGEEFDMSYVARDIPTLTRSANAHMLENFELDEIVWENNNTEDEETSFKLDIAKAFDFGNNTGEFKFGGKYRSREKFNDADVTIYDGDFDGLSAADFADAVPQYSIGDFGPGLSRSALRNYFRDNQSDLSIDNINSTVDSDGLTYTSSEDIMALYGMVSLDIDRWYIVAGVRYEDTDFETQGNQVEAIADEDNDSETVTTTPWRGEKSYSHILPNLNVRFDVNDKLVTRFAYTETIARPNFEDSAAFQLIEREIEDGETALEAEAGNPDLDPYESSNLDLSIEYYPGNVGVLSAGLFYKNIDNFIIQEEVQDNGEWDGFDEVVQKVNGGSAELTGLELAWTKTFKFGLLLGANATLTDADDALPNQSDTIGNLMVGYEDRRISTRLSLNHKSETFQFFDNDLEVYQDTHNQLDFTFKYAILSGTQIYFNAVNITDEPFYLYHGDSRYNYQYETYGRTYELGISFTSF